MMLDYQYEHEIGFYASYICVVYCRNKIRTWNCGKGTFVQYVKMIVTATILVHCRIIIVSF